MFNIQYNGVEALPNINKVTIDFVERPSKYSFEDMLKEANDPNSSTTKADFLLKNVYEGQGGNEIVNAHIRKKVSQMRNSNEGSKIRLSEEDIYSRLIDELNRHSDYDDDKGKTNDVQKYVLGTVMGILLKSLSTPGSGTFDSHFFSSEFITESEQSIEDGVFSTEALISTKGSIPSYYSPEESFSTEEEREQARADLVRYIEVLYDFQMSSSSIKDEEVVTNLLQHLQQVAALSSIQGEVEFVQSRLGKDNKDALAGGLKPDSRKNRRMSKNINKEGHEDSYHARIVLNATLQDFAKEKGDRVYVHAIQGIARCCDILEIPLPMLDADKIMRASYIRELYSCLNGRSTLNITEYDLLEYQQQTTYMDVYTEAIKKQVKKIKVNGSSLPDSKMHIVISPSVKEEIRNIQLGEIKHFSEFVKNTAIRGVELWKTKDKHVGEVNAKVAADSSEERRKRKVDDMRMAAIGVDATKGETIKYKMGPAHPKTLDYIDSILFDYHSKLLRKGELADFEKRRDYILNAIYEPGQIDSGSKLEWRNNYLFDLSKNDYIRIDVPSYPFNKRVTDDPEGENYFDYLLHKKGFLVSNYISCYFPYHSKTKYIYSLESDFAGLIILTTDKKLVHQE